MSQGRGTAQGPLDARRGKRGQPSAPAPLLERGTSVATEGLWRARGLPAAFRAVAARTRSTWSMVTLQAYQRTGATATTSIKRTAPDASSGEGQVFPQTAAFCATAGWSRCVRATSPSFCNVLAHPRSPEATDLFTRMAAQGHIPSQKVGQRPERTR